MIRIVRSELVRIWRPSFRYGGIGAMAGFGAMISIFIFTSANDTAQTTQTAQAGPGGGFASAAQISQPGGFLTALGTTSQISGLVLLPLWAIAAASDYDTGLIRVLVQAQPNRLKLLTGKMIALTGFTVLATAITTLVIVLVARPLARLEGIDTEPWKTDFLPGGTLAALADGGTADLAWVAALGLTLAYGTAAAIGALLIFRNRDITS